MRIEVIDNELPIATMGRELEKAFATASAANCATAFLTPAGTRFLGNVLTDAQKQKQDLHIRLIVGLYLRFTSAQTLHDLIRLQKRHTRRLEVRVARNERFHWKLFIFRSKSATLCYVGSSNLTTAGLEKNGEINVKVSDHSPTYHALIAEFDDLWKEHTRSVESVFPLYERLDVHSSGTGEATGNSAVGTNVIGSGVKSCIISSVERFRDCLRHGA